MLSLYNIKTLSCNLPSPEPWSPPRLITHGFLSHRRVLNQNKNRHINTVIYSAHKT